MAKKKAKKSSDSLLKAFGNCNCSSLLLTSLVVFVAMFALDFLVHSVLLKDLYAKFYRLFLPMAMMKARMGYMLVGQVLLSLLLVFVYSQGFSGKGTVNEGIRYGAYVGLLMTLPSALISYSWSWYPVVLISYWGIAMFVQFVIYGAIIGAMYKK